MEWRENRHGKRFVVRKSREGRTWFVNEYFGCSWSWQHDVYWASSFQDAIRFINARLHVEPKRVPE